MAQNKTAGNIGVWSNNPPNSLTDTGNATAPGNFTVEGNLNVLGTINSLPGHVRGPTPTKINELASWANTTGSLQREGGMGRITDYITGPIASTSWELSALSDSNITAYDIYMWSFCETYPICPGATTHDAVQGVVHLTPGSTTWLVTGIAGYALSSAPLAGSGPAVSAVFGQAICDVDGSGCWGSNFTVADNRGLLLTPGTGLRYAVAQEIDCDTSRNTTECTAMLIQGNVRQSPVGATALNFAYLDFFGHGSVAKWDQLIFSFDGTANVFAVIGAQSYTGANANGQAILYAAHNNTGAPIVSTQQFLSNGAMHFSTELEAYGLHSRTGANANIHITGDQIISTNDANSNLLPLNVLSQHTSFNSPIGLEQKTLAALDPECAAATRGTIAVQTDAGGTPVWGGAAVPGGTAFHLVLCTGTQWIYQ